MIDPSDDVLLSLGRRDRMCREYLGYCDAGKAAKASEVVVEGNRPDPSRLPYLLDGGKVVRFEFSLSDAQAKRPARLRIHTADQADKIPTKVVVTLNGRRSEASLSPGLGIQRTDPAHLAFPATLEFPVSAADLRLGKNVLEVRVQDGGWFSWDAMDLVSNAYEGGQEAPLGALRRLPLGGSDWKIASFEPGQGTARRAFAEGFPAAEAAAAVVPGDVHWDLERAGKMSADLLRPEQPADRLGRRQGVVVSEGLCRMPPAWQGKTVRLQFDGVDYLADVWLNGRIWAGMRDSSRPSSSTSPGCCSPDSENVLAVLIHSAPAAVRKATGRWRMADDAGHSARLSLLEVHDQRRLGLGHEDHHDGHLEGRAAGGLGRCFARRTPSSCRSSAALRSGDAGYPAERPGGQTACGGIELTACDA